MQRLSRAHRVVLFVMLLLAFPAVSIAQQFPSSCTSTAQCPDGTSCQVGAFGLKWCLFEFCNTDSVVPEEAPYARWASVDFLGDGGGGGGAGIGQSGEGGPCGPHRFATGVIKSIGCKRGLVLQHIWTVPAACSHEPATRLDHESRTQPTTAWSASSHRDPGARFCAIMHQHDMLPGPLWSTMCPLRVWLRRTMLSRTAELHPRYLPICSGSTGGGGGIGQSGEGGSCGPQRLGGGVIKSIGCKRGLFCNTIGRCQRLPT